MLLAPDPPVLLIEPIRTLVSDEALETNLVVVPKDQVLRVSTKEGTDAASLDVDVYQQKGEQLTSDDRTASNHTLIGRNPSVVKVLAKVAVELVCNPFLDAGRSQERGIASA